MKNTQLSLHLIVNPEGFPPKIRKKLRMSVHATSIQHYTVGSTKGSFQPGRSDLYSNSMTAMAKTLPCCFSLTSPHTVVVHPKAKVTQRRFLPFRMPKGVERVEREGENEKGYDI